MLPHLVDSVVAITGVDINNEALAIAAKRAKELNIEFNPVVADICTRIVPNFDSI